MRTTGAGSILMLVGSGGQTTTFDTCFGFGNTNPAIFSTATTGSNSCLGSVAIVGGTFNAAGTTGQTITVTQCYGNCGNPPITLANTNSTHLIAFNQSATLLYQFQSNTNGFLLNVTTNAAKTNTNNGITLMTYTIPSGCPAGQLPFTPNCPGVLFPGFVQQPDVKGRVSNVYGRNAIPVTNGLWIAIGLSCTFSPCDINDTNTNVTPLLQTAAGPAPNPTLTSTTNLGASKTGLWAWIVGNLVSGGPPTSPGTGQCVNNFAQLDCLIPGMVNSLCSVVTASCQTSGSLFWIIMLTFLSFLLLTVGFASAHVTKFVAAGDVFMFMFLAWFFIFAGLGVLQSFVVIFFLFIGAVAFGKTARNYF